MKREKMVCPNCVKYEDGECRLNPIPILISEILSKTYDALDPATHWCAQGVWEEWNERYQEMIPRHWGEWEKNK